jgi:transcriptional regulator with XRE-family HTH domain
MTEARMTYGARLRAHREQRKETQADIAARMGITQPEVARYEKGEPKRPSPDQLRSLARAYGVPVVALLMYAGYLSRREIDDWLATGDDDAVDDAVMTDRRADGSPVPDRDRDAGS